MIRSLFERKALPPPALPPGRRAYAVGDVHGRLDLLDTLLAMIRADSERRPAAEVDIVLLGDLIDRGPDSAGVVARAMTSPSWAHFVVLQGNHEDAMLAALEGDRDMCRIWLRNGGDAALASWGVLDEIIAEGTLGEVIEAAQKVIPAECRNFLARAPHSFRLGDYYFVHAGVRPGVGLHAQASNDSLWIRDEFLRSKQHHGAMIVHGHSVANDVEERPNRIGLDTGAYASGKLTALGLEGKERWLLQTGVSVDRVYISH